MQKFLSRLRGIFLGVVVWIIYRAIQLTWRVSVFEPPELKENLKTKKTTIFSHFHGDELVLISLVNPYRIATMASTSKDGEIMNTVLNLLGGKTSRGSSTRGGVGALKGLIQLCKSGRNSSIAVDGPKGPIYEIKPGVFELSRLTQSEIYAGGVFCERAWRFPKSWNQTFLPKPFAKVSVVWLGPIGPVTKQDDPRSADLAKALQNQLFAAKSRAANLFGGAATEL